MYRHRFDEIRDCWRRYDGDLVRALPRAAGRGAPRDHHLHGDAPVLPAPRSQLGGVPRAGPHRGRASTSGSSAAAPQGIWLGECGYVPGVDELLREEGIRFFFVDTHGVLFAEPRPLYGVHAPVYCRSGVAAFGRDIESSQAGVERAGGLPGRPELPRLLPRHRLRPAARLHRAVHPPGGHPHVHRRQVLRGHAPHRWTTSGPTTRTRAYLRAAEHAGNFMFNRERQIEHLRANMDRRPIVVAPYDAELFGHWWYEGPMFLELLFRKLHYDQGERRADHAERLPRASTRPTRWRRRRSRRGARRATATSGATAATTGSTGTCTRWPSAWCELARRFPSADGLQRRALNQAARELMLAQASDWAFIMKTGTTVPYATKRTVDHVTRFTAHLRGADARARSTSAGSREVERRDNLFPDVDYRVYAS